MGERAWEVKKCILRVLGLRLLFYLCIFACELGVGMWVDPLPGMPLARNPGDCVPRAASVCGWGLPARMMTENNMVSVIIPVYNAAAWVSDTVRSVLASTYADIEVVCVDDGSTDSSLAVLRTLASTDPRVRVLHQENAGVCHARNAAIAASCGEYVLPVDADDLLMPRFIGQAVEVLQARPEVKVVAPAAEFFGERTGPWRLPAFTLKREAHKNVLAACAMYRRADYDRTDGYCAEVIAREDWEFWINMLKGGGEVVRLPELGLRYRVQKGGKRKSDRLLKRHVIDVLNARHPEFFEQWLGGPLRYWRSWSRCINTVSRLFCPRRVHIEDGHEGLRYFVASLPERLAQDGAGPIYNNEKDEARVLDTPWGKLTVYSFRATGIMGRLACPLFRASEAEQMCRNAVQARQKGAERPVPVGWCSVNHGSLLSHSYYACLHEDNAVTHTHTL